MMKDPNAVYMIGNGHMAASFIRGNLISAYGPPYTSPSVLESVFLPDGAWRHELPHHEARCAIWTVGLSSDTASAAITDLAFGDENCLVRHIEASPSLKMRLRPKNGNDALFHYVTVNRRDGVISILFKTRSGIAAYNDYPMPFPQFFTLLVRGDAEAVQCGAFSFDITVTGTADLLLIGGPDYPSCDRTAQRISDVPYDVMLAETRKWWSEQMAALPERGTLPKDLPHREAIADALEDTAICLLVQQSAEGGIQAGQPFHLAYVRDQFGMCMALLHMGLFDQARRMLCYYLDVFRKNGKILNAQAMGVNGMFHFAENDSAELPGYLLLQFFRYAQFTGDTELLSENTDFLMWLYDRQASQLSDGMIPFNGDETYIAGGLMPRDVINDGSAEATMLFLLSGKCLLDFLERNHSVPSAVSTQMRETLSQTEAAYPAHFVKDGRYILNNPDRLKNAVLPEYRYGVCMNLGRGECNFFGWTKKSGDAYLCPRCIARHVEIQRTVRLYALPSALLMPAYLGSDLPDKTLVTEYLRELTERLLRDGYVYSDENGRRNVGYDYGLLLYNLTSYDLPGADIACEKLLSLRDEIGVWSEYYDEDRFAGSRYRPWESAINASALLNYVKSFARKKEDAKKIYQSASGRTAPLYREGQRVEGRCQDCGQQV